MNNTMKALLASTAGATARGTVLCSTVLIAALPAASASDATSPGSVADMIRAAHAATSAEVFIVPKTVYTVKQIDQDEVPKYGCLYKVDQGDMGGLLAIVDRANIENRSPPERYLDLRILIRLHNPDGALTTVAFRQRPLYQDALYGFVNGIDARAALDFAQNLERWVAGLAPPIHPSHISCP